MNKGEGVVGVVVWGVVVCVCKMHEEMGEGGNKEITGKKARWQASLLPPLAWHHILILVLLGD